MKRNFKISLGCIVKKSQSPNGLLEVWLSFVGLLLICWQAIRNDWLGFLNSALIAIAFIGIVFKSPLVSLIFLPLCLIICLFRLIITKEEKYIFIRTFNVFITAVILIWQILNL